MSNENIRCHTWQNKISLEGILTPPSPVQVLYCLTRREGKRCPLGTCSVPVYGFPPWWVPPPSLQLLLLGRERGWIPDWGTAELFSYGNSSVLVEGILIAFHFHLCIFQPSASSWDLRSLMSLEERRIQPALCQMRLLFYFLQILTEKLASFQLLMPPIPLTFS